MLVVLAAAILSGFWFFLARRRRRRPEPGLVPATASPYSVPRPPLPAALVRPPKLDKPPKPDKVRKPTAPLVETLAPGFADAIPAAPSAALVEPYGEANMPRWRRPSLATARYASSQIMATPAPAITFAAGAHGGLERRRVRYDLVALTDMPDETRGAQVGQLQANDEVEIIGRKGVWLNVRTPVGAEGWIHRTTLQAVEETSEAVDAEAPPAAARPPLVPVTPPTGGSQASIEAEVTLGAFAAAAAAAARLHEVEEIPGAAAVSEPPLPSKPAKRPRTRRPASPRAAPNA